jgi:hypothetical protein
VLVGVGWTAGQLPGLVAVPVSNLPIVWSGREVSWMTLASILISLPARALAQALLVWMMTFVERDWPGGMSPAFHVLGETLATYWLPFVTLIWTTTPVAAERWPLLLTFTLKFIGPQLDPPPLITTLRLASEAPLVVGVGVGVPPWTEREVPVGVDVAVAALVGVGVLVGVEVAAPGGVLVGVDVASAIGVGVGVDVSADGWQALTVKTWGLAKL